MGSNPFVLLFCMDTDQAFESMTCIGCLTHLPMTEFYRDPRKESGHRARCKACHVLGRDREAERAAARRRYHENPATRERILLQNRRHRIKATYGLDVDAHLALVYSHGGACAICGRMEGDRTRSDRPISLCIDHDHETGEVRGILCDPCNRGLGLLGDDLEGAKRAFRYLSGVTSVTPKALTRT